MKTICLAALLLLRSVACNHIELHPEYQSGLSINNAPAHRRDYWMRIANEAIYEDSDPCPQAPFGTVIVNTTSDEIVCVAANKVGVTGDPTMHVHLIDCKARVEMLTSTQGEITTIRKCTEVLSKRGLSPKEILSAWKHFSLYTNGEPCPMCMSAIRWAGFKEVIYGTSIGKIAQMGRNQIYIPSSYVLQKSYSLGHQTLIIGNILTNETDVLFGHQFNESAPCPTGCHRVHPAGQRVSQCKASDNWRDEVRKVRLARGDVVDHDEL